MPNSNTANYSLVKPEVGGATDDWGALLNSNLDVIDTKIKAATDAASNASTSASLKIPLTGGSMSDGSVLKLGSHPAANSDDLTAATKKYVNDEVAKAEVAAGVGLPIDGSKSMTGLLTLSGDPSSPLHAATKQYVDNKDSLSVVKSAANNAAQTITSPIYWSGTFDANTSSQQLATKSYVDTKQPSGVALLTTTSSQTFLGPITVPSLASNGAISCSTLTASLDITLTSDVRVKEDIRQIDDALSLVCQLRGVSYVRKDTKKASVGVIAQEVEQVIPALVYTDDSGMKSVAYGNIVGVLIEAVKELTQRINELEAR